MPRVSVNQSTKVLYDNVPVSAFALVIGEGFKTYTEAVLYGHKTERLASTGAVDANIKATYTDAGPKGSVPEFFARGTRRDTTLGGNDAINPFWQFNRDDDIAYVTVGPEQLPGLGSVYEEEYNDKQQILWLSFGIPMYNTMEGFFNGAISKQMAEVVSTGTTSEGSTIGKLIGTLVGEYIMLPAVPLIFVHSILTKLGKHTKFTKYFDFRSAMDQYWRYVNGIVQTMAVNMGLAGDGHFETHATGSNEELGSARVSTDQELMAKATAVLPNAPPVIKKHGWDMYRIISRRYEYDTEKNIKSTETTDAAFLANLKKTTAKGTTTESWLANTWSWVKSSTTAVVDGVANQLSVTASISAAAAMDAQLYVGFRISRPSDVSESIQNSSSQPQIAQSLQAKIGAAQQAKFSTMFNNIGDSALASAMSGIIGTVSDAMASTAASVGYAGLDEILRGNGQIDIPDVYTGSAFSRSYSFDIPLRAPLGDPWSIMSSIIAPLACLMPGIFARAVGPASYQSPMLVKAYCKGYLSINAGLMENVTITRGGDQHGWTYQRMPTVMNVSFNIKELAPAMYMPMPDLSDIFFEIWGANTAFQEYLTTLSGMGLAERSSLWYNLRRKMQRLRNIAYTELLSPYAWGYKLGTSSLFAAIGALNPAIRLPNN